MNYKTLLKKTAFYGIFALLMFCLTGHATGRQDYSFQEAKKQARVIWQSHRITTYCGCEYDKYLFVNFKSCDYEPKDRRRAQKVEWEHIVPASWFGYTRPCWKKPLCKKKNGERYKGRKCCEHSDKLFRKMHSDLHNLVPIIGEVNAARAAYAMTEINEEEKNKMGNFNNCLIFISDATKSVEPRDEIKGLVARAHLYMADTYGVKLRHTQKELMIKWNQAYPPTAWEVTWNQKIKKLNGTDNIYISQYHPLIKK